MCSRNLLPRWLNHVGRIRSLHCGVLLSLSGFKVPGGSKQAQLSPGRVSVQYRNLLPRWLHNLGGGWTLRCGILLPLGGGEGTVPSRPLLRGWVLYEPRHRPLRRRSLLSSRLQNIGGGWTLPGGILLPSGG